MQQPRGTGSEVEAPPPTPAPLLSPFEPPGVDVDGGAVRDQHADESRPGLPRRQEREPVRRDGLPHRSQGRGAQGEARAAELRGGGRGVARGGQQRVGGHLPGAAGERPLERARVFSICFFRGEGEREGRSRERERDIRRLSKENGRKGEKR